MTRSLWLSVRVAGWMGFLVGSTTLAAASPPVANSEAAQQAVAEALNYEALGQNHERARLLHEAAELSDIAEVQWARGYVQYKDRWLRPDEIVEQSRTDTLLEEYRARRKLADQVLQAHRLLGVGDAREAHDGVRHGRIFQSPESAPGRSEAIDGGADGTVRCNFPAKVLR